MSCAFLYTDRSRTATVASSGTLGDGGVDRLADPQPRHRARFDGAAVNFTMDLGAVVDVDVFALVSTTLTAASDVRVRASDTDPAATSSLTYDSGVLASVTHADWLGQVVLALTASIAARYVRWDLSEPSAPSIDVGLAPLGLLWRPLRNYAYGAQRGYQDYGVRDGSSLTGGMFTVDGPKARLQAFALAALSEAEMKGAVTQMDLMAGVARDVLWIPETEHTPLQCAQDAIWGGFKQVGAPAVATHDNFAMLSRSYQMTERL